jgi:hypothetical protein
MPRNQFEEFNKRMRLLAREAEKPMPEGDTLPEPFRGKTFSELGPTERIVFQVNKMIGVNWLAIMELDAAVAAWRWNQLNSRCSFHASRTNVIRLMAQIEWRVRQRCEDAYKPGGLKSDDPFIALMREVNEVMTRLPSPGPGRPGRKAGISPARNPERMTLEEIMPESLDRL